MYLALILLLFIAREDESYYFIFRQRKLEAAQSYTVWSMMTKSLPILLINTVINCWGYAMVGLTAIAFVLWNGSVVVGDKSAHEATFNAPQLGYFACFTLGMSIFHLVSLGRVARFLTALWDHKLITIVSTLISLALVHHFTQVHPYLLADNRHYTFYVWSKLYARYPPARYALVSLYLFSLWSINDRVKHVHPMIRACLWFCITAALVPQQLMEFRYFVVPYLFIRLHMKDESIRSLFLEMSLYLAINIFTVYRFLYKPIFWPNLHEPQRLMW